jgi:hypothetical protein
MVMRTLCGAIFPADTSLKSQKRQSVQVLACTVLGIRAMP